MSCKVHAVSGPAASWTCPAGHATMGIVGTVDSAYKALAATEKADEALARAARRRIALAPGLPVA